MMAEGEELETKLLYGSKTGPLALQSKGPEKLSKLLLLAGYPAILPICCAANTINFLPAPGEATLTVSNDASVGVASDAGAQECHGTFRRTLPRRPE
jgi:hypothetical protein